MHGWSFASSSTVLLEKHLPNACYQSLLSIIAINYCNQLLLSIIAISHKWKRSFWLQSFCCRENRLTAVFMAMPWTEGFLNLQHSLAEMETIIVHLAKAMWWQMPMD